MADSEFRRNISGPSGEYVKAPEQAFHSSSYLGQAADKAQTAQDEDEFVSGLDTMSPTRLPAKVFRLATVLLVLLWLLGTAVPFGAVKEFMTKPLIADVFVKETPNAEGTERGSALRKVQKTKEEEDQKAIDALPRLPMGQRLAVEWPTHGGFVPRSLSCDPSGTRFIVADDLGVYAGHLVARASPTYMGGSGPTPHSRPRELTGSATLSNLWQQGSQLLDPVAKASVDGADAHNAGVAMAATAASEQHSVLAFTRVPPCSALEGQLIKDIGVVCSPPVNGDEGECHAIVLHSRGRRLAECRLPRPQSGSAEVARAIPASREAAQRIVWTISSAWLEEGEANREQVEAIAITNKCRVGDPAGERREANEACAYVGTTTGRLVELGAAYDDSRLLVPKRAVQQQRSTSIGPGSMHVLPNGIVVALRRDRNSVQAFDSQLAEKIGEWKLPTGLRWLTLCGGGDGLFLVGLRNYTKAELHAFRTPAELKVEPKGADAAPKNGVGHLYVPPSRAMEI